MTIIKVHTMSYGMYEEINEFVTDEMLDGLSSLEKMKDLSNRYQTYCNMQLWAMAENEFKYNSWIPPVVIDDEEWYVITDVMETKDWTMCHECYEKFILYSKKKQKFHFKTVGFDLSQSSITANETMTWRTVDEVMNNDRDTS